MTTKETAHELLREMEEKMYGEYDAYNKDNLDAEALALVYDSPAEAFYAGRDKGLSAAQEIIRKAFGITD